MSGPTTAPSVRRAPRARLVTGHLADFARDPLAFLSAAAAGGEPVVPLRFGRTRAVLLTEPALVETVLVGERRHFVKAAALRAQHRLLGRGLLTNEGESWLRQRRLAQPAFRRERVAGYGDVAATAAARLLDGWTPGEVRDVQRELRDLLMTIAARTLFGADVGARTERIGGAVDEAMTRYAARRGLRRLLPAWLPTAGERAYARAVAALDAEIARLVRERRDRAAADARADDLLAMLLAARDEDGTGMDDRQLRDEVVTLLVGGFDTPSLALTWAWHLLATHPAVAAEVATEVDATLGGRAPTAADLPRLRLTDAVVREAMRLYPPAWLLAREAVADVTLGGRRVRAGSLVLMSQWVLHRDARHFAAPTEFRPARWLDGSLDGLPRFAYLPFGGGPRVCIGAGLATLQSVLVLATVAQRLRFVAAPGAAPVPWATMTLRPRDGVPVVVTPR